MAQLVAQSLVGPAVQSGVPVGDAKKSDKFLFPISLILRFEGFEGFIVDLQSKRKAYEFTYAHGYEKLSMKHQGH